MRKKTAPKTGVVPRRSGKNPGSNEFLALLQTDEHAAEIALARLSLADQKGLALALPPGQRARILYLVPDTEALVRSMPEREFHRTVQTLGKWEVQELVEVSSEEQIVFMVDHDCWRGERLDSHRFNDWLRLFMSCDDSQVYRLLAAIPPDTLALALKKHVKFDKDIMINDTYYCDPGWVKGTSATMQEFLERLYALEPGLWIRLMGWVRTQSKPTIEADAIEGHESRLTGKGFPTPSLAISIYYPVDYDVKGMIRKWYRQYQRINNKSQVEQLPLSFESEKLFIEELGETLSRQRDSANHHVPRLESALADIANKVMIADQVDIGDAACEREALDKVRRWINIGLEVATGRDLARAEDLLATEGLEYFFRLASMMFDAVSTAAVELQKAEQRSGGRLAMSPFIDGYFALIEPEPHIPSIGAGSAGRALVSLATYRYAWELIWRFQQMLQD